MLSPTKIVINTGGSGTKLVFTELDNRGLSASHIIVMFVPTGIRVDGKIVIFKSG